MIVIDGSEGEGGGQVLRNAVALSLLTGLPFRIFNIRGRRSKPGLMRQHVTAIEAAAAISGSACEGVHVGSAQIEFRPGRVRGGSYRFAVGTAGSTGLVLQTVLVPLLLAEAPSTLVLEGGTHNMAAPPYDFIAAAFLPLVNRMGPRVAARLLRHGFYPAGGGAIEVDIEPCAALQPIELLERGALLEVEARAIVSGLAASIADRELEIVRARLGWPEPALQHVRLPEQHGPGNILLLRARFEQVTEIVSGFGQLGVTAGHVADRAAGRMAGYLASTAAVGPYLADQLLLPLAVAGGGRFTTVKPSQHALTAAEVIGRFLERSVRFQPQADGRFLVTVT